MKLVKLSAVAIAALTLGTAVQADVKGNMNVVYNQLPSSVDNITDAFSEGMFYGRLRANAFRWDWDNNDNGDNKAFGLGGSLVYKSAPLNGVSVTTSLYYSSSPFSELRENSADVGDVKAGKDTFSRYNVSQTGDWQMGVLAEAYVQYHISKTDFKLGRQIFQTLLRVLVLNRKSFQKQLLKVLT